MTWFQVLKRNVTSKQRLWRSHVDLPSSPCPSASCSGYEVSKPRFCCLSHELVLKKKNAQGNLSVPHDDSSAHHLWNKWIYQMGGLDHQFFLSFFFLSAVHFCLFSVALAQLSFYFSVERWFKNGIIFACWSLLVFFTDLHFIVVHHWRGRQ